MTADGNGIFARLFGPGRATRSMLASPGLWVADDSLEGADTPASVLPAVHRPRYLRRLDPGAPLPDGVDPGAARYEMVVHNELPQRFRGPTTLAGAAATLGSIGVLMAGHLWGVPVLVAGLALVAGGISGGAERVTFRRTPEGRWVEADGVVVDVEPPPLFGRWTRVLLGVLSAFAFWLALTRAGEMPWDEILIAVGLGVGLGAGAVFDSLPIRDRDPSAAFRSALRFYELADPTVRSPPKTWASRRSMAIGGTAPHCAKRFDAG